MDSVRQQDGGLGVIIQLMIRLRMDQLLLE